VVWCRVALIQLCGPGGCLLLQPTLLLDNHATASLSPALPPSLAALLSDAHVIKAGVGVHDDVKRLARDWGCASKVRVSIVTDACMHACMDDKWVGGWIGGWIERRDCVQQGTSHKAHHLK
jgi:hypothetical protein